jgi:rRNA processing protein Krr1/Pno1
MKDLLLKVLKQMKASLTISYKFKESKINQESTVKDIFSIYESKNAILEIGKGFSKDVIQLNEKELKSIKKFYKLKDYSVLPFDKDMSVYVEEYEIY